MKPTWSVQNEIQKRADRESLAEWGKSKNTIKLPAMRPVDYKPSINWRIFFLTAVTMFKP